MLKTHTKIIKIILKEKIIIEKNEAKAEKKKAQSDTYHLEFKKKWNCVHPMSLL